MPQRVLALELWELRERVGLSREDAAAILDQHQGTLRRMERAETGPKKLHASTLIDAYTERLPAAQRDPVAKHLRELLRVATERGWWHDHRDVLPPWLRVHIGIETYASQIRVWSPCLVPELLQTPDYARALYQVHCPREDPEVTERRVELLQRRQAHTVYRQDCAVWALLSESAWTSGPGGPDILAAQRDHVERLAVERTSGVTVQVMPQRSPLHPIADIGGFRIVRVPHPQIADTLLRRCPREGMAIEDDEHTIRAYRVALDQAVAVAPNPLRPTRL
ncbi:helix-turn-helix transcriptional regulator [Streptomyces sp. SM12]|uniref:helix-turn-helix domain-containing protein n=1 Tax=Streptomyces sp. SM12 TaxID=1071602 RepID=UPI000CD4AF10|nr:helix-turn-helix transcriptional regulator [Streptomyces sp. SM12]